MSQTLKIKFIRSYRSKNGTPTFVYAVTGSAEAHAAYAEAQGSFLRTDENTGEVLWFTTRFVGDKCDLLVTDTGKVIADMSKFEQAASLCEQFNGVFGEKLAEHYIRQLTGKQQPQLPPDDEAGESGQPDL